MSGAGLSEGLVEGRACGTCTVCCYALPIDAPEIQKLPGVVCENCTGRGCRIYESRPTPCRKFFCGWWLLPQLDDEWRPDRSGVLITPETNDIPPEYELRDGIEFLIVGGEAAVRRPGFVEFVSLCVQRRIPTFVSVAGPEGFFAAKVLVNRKLETAAGSDQPRVLSLLLAMVEQAKDHTFQRAVLTHGPVGSASER
jgi:hypothetical protein